MKTPRKPSIGSRRRGGGRSEMVEEFGANAPLKRPGQSAEVAGAYVLLASDEASYISGAMLPVTRGPAML
jgi:NAD(P)-dependent dehydrogenase (short-subunit alcohol dehydrogenase family)